MKCKNPDCNEEVVRGGIGAPKLFHNVACQRAYHLKRQRERKFKGARLADHTISDPDPETRLGTCAQCGPGVKILKGGGKDRPDRWRCAKQMYEQRAVREPDWVRNPIGERVRSLRKRGAIASKEAVEYLLKRADGHCEYCGKAAEVEVDHDHATGALRGCLCTHCNLWLGKLGDNADGLNRVVAYLLHPTREWPSLRVVPLDDVPVEERVAEPRHCLTEKDEEARRAICSVCGPTKLYGGHVVGTYKDGRPRRAWWCANRVKADQVRIRKTSTGRERKWRGQGMKGATFELWHAMLIAQSGRCAICERCLFDPQNDHAHTKDKLVRGLLCVPCNTALGYGGDDEFSAIQKWFRYLARAEAENVSGRFPYKERKSA